MNPRVVWSAAAVFAAACGVAAQQVAQAARTAGIDDEVRPPLHLADTGLYDASGAIDSRNWPFAPQYPLWSDGLTKRRWVYLPPGTTIDGTDEYEWTFPVGTRFWKEFSQHDRKVETRMMWKTSDRGWAMVTYIWNAAGTQAVLAPDEGVPAVIEIVPGRRHSVPSRSDCTACHSAEPRPLGFNALQLSTDRDAQAIHGEPLRSGMITLAELVIRRLITPVRADLVSNPPRIRTSSDSSRAVLGYLIANCGTCHNGSGDIAAARPVLTYRDLVRDGDAVVASLIEQPTRWQIPGTADGTSVLIQPGAPDLSALVARMRSRSPSSQMPPLGTVIRDDRAVEAMTRWIAVELSRSD